MRYLALIPFLVAGCMPPVGSATVTTAYQLDSGKEVSWNAIVQVYTERGYGIQTIEKDSGVISTFDLNSSDLGYFACEDWRNISPLQIRLRFSMLLQEVTSESSKLTINTTASVLRGGGAFGIGDPIWSPCPSTEVFEAEIVGQIRSRIEQATK